MWESMGRGCLVARHAGVRGSVLTSGLSGICLGMVGYEWIPLRHDSL